MKLQLTVQSLTEVDEVVERTRVLILQALQQFPGPVFVDVEANNPERTPTPGRVVEVLPKRSDCVNPWAR